MGNCSGTVRGDERWSAGIRSEGNPAPEVEFDVGDPAKVAESLQLCDAKLFSSK
jgi:hypothetical protein